MKKKVYIKPEICVLQLDIQAALATSSVQQAPEEDYTNENVKGLWDKNGVSPKTRLQATSLCTQFC